MKLHLFSAPMTTALWLILLAAPAAITLAQTSASTPASAPTATSQAAASDRLYRVCKAGKVGFIDSNGKLVLSTDFQVGSKSWVNEFHDGLAMASVDDKRGYIDRSGKFAIKPQYKSANDFSEGLAPVQIGDKWGFIDTKGEVVISPQFDYAWPFSEGLAMYQVVSAPGSGLNKFGFIDRKGNIVISPQPYDNPGYKFRDGMLTVCTGGKYSVLDKTGKVVVADMEYVGQFSEGLAVAKRDMKFGYIDKTGKWIIEPQYVVAGNFSEGVAIVMPLADQKIGYIDRTGKIVIEPQYFHAGPFHEGLAKVALLPPGSTYKNTGRMVTMTLVGKFQFGFIDKAGKLVIPYRFDEVEDFDDGIARVQMDRKVGYIDHAGRFVWAPSE